MKTILKLMTFVLSVSAVAGAQVAPEATGPGGPPASEKFNYALRYAHTIQIGSQFSTQQIGILSGSAAYLSSNDRHPTNIQYGGGYSWNFTGQSYGSGFFQHLFLGQGFNWRKWKIQLSDDASYAPQTPVIGFSGIPGIGEPIGTTSPAPPSSQTILALNTHEVDNAVRGNISHNLSASTSVSGGGSYELLRFPNNDGLNTDNVTGEFGLEHSISGRSVLLGNYAYANYNYPDYNVNFTTNTALFGFDHKWTRNLSSSISAGPQWLSSSIPTIVPAATDVSVLASVSYLGRFSSMGASYNRSVNGGAGYLIGGEANTASANYVRTYGPDLSLGFTAGYNRTSGLNSNGTTTGFLGGTEVIWHVSRDLEVFGNYSATDQTTSSSLPGNALNQLLHVVGFGVGYSPRLARGKQ